MAFFSILLLVLQISLACAAPSGRGHLMAHRRRERFLHRHNEDVRRIIGNGPKIHHRPFEREPYCEHRTFVNGTTFVNETIMEEEKVAISNPNKPLHRRPSNTANNNSASNIAYSGNWCGVVHEGSPTNSTFTAVEATWTMPTLAPPNGSDLTGGQQPGDQPQTFYGSQWVGIDGYTFTGAILQAGTTSAVSIAPNGSIVNTASAWFEWYPNPETEINEFDVSPGDEIFCSIMAYNSSVGTVTLRNTNTGQSISKDFSSPDDAANLEGVNAEWIYEDFSAGGLVPFASFTPTTFSGCQATTADGDKVGLSNATTIYLSDGDDVICNAKVAGSDQMVVQYGPATGT